VLNRPQSSQRGDLGLSQSSDACDIEPLVGSVVSQCQQMLVTGQIPDLDGSIIPTASQLSPVGTDPEGLDCPLVCRLHTHTFPALYIPPA
jgi:hypothetical protein